MRMQRQYARAGCRLGLQILTILLLLFAQLNAQAQERDVEGAKRWQLGDPAPLGYRVARKHTLGIVGGSLLAGGYGMSALYGVVLRTECYTPGADGSSNNRPCDAEPLYHAAPLLFVPVVGPFLALGREEVRRDGGAVFWFSVFGTLQVVGAGLLSYDLAVPHFGLKKWDGVASANRARRRILIAPASLEAHPGLVFLGEF